MTDDELPDFEDYGDAPESESTDGEEQVRRIRNEQENPIGLDPRVGVKDVAYDRAKPGAKVQVVSLLSETVEDYYEEFPDAPALDDYAGNVITSFTDEDAVFACVYLKDSLTSVDTNLTAYPMPESRLTRYPVESASMVGSSSVEFERTPVPEDDPHRLAGAEPEQVPDDADRDEDGEAVLTEEN